MFEEEMQAIKEESLEAHAARFAFLAEHPVVLHEPDGVRHFKSLEAAAHSAMFTSYVDPGKVWASFAGEDFCSAQLRQIWQAFDRAPKAYVRPDGARAFPPPRVQ